MKKNKRNKKQQQPDFVKEMYDKLLENFNAQVSDRAIEILNRKGFVFESQQDLFSFFKERVKSFFSPHNGETKLAVDDQPFMAYLPPKFDQSGQEITIKLEYVEL